MFENVFEMTPPKGSLRPAVFHRTKNRRSCLNPSMTRRTAPSPPPAKAIAWRPILETWRTRHPDLYEDWQERSAIMEYMGEMVRETAEREAFRTVLDEAVERWQAKEDRRKLADAVGLSTEEYGQLRTILS